MRLIIKKVKQEIPLPRGGRIIFTDGSFLKLKHPIPVQCKEMIFWFLDNGNKNDLIVFFARTINEQSLFPEGKCYILDDENGPYFGTNELDSYRNEITKILDCRI